MATTGATGCCRSNGWRGVTSAPLLLAAPVYRDNVYCADALAFLRGMPDASVDCIVTSPPYYWQRDYGVSGQLGHEDTPEQYIDALCQIFAEGKRVLSATGVLYLNLADTYYSGNGQPQGQDSKCSARNFSRRIYRAVDRPGWDIPKKSLIGIPWRVALALQRQRWTLRSAIVWVRQNAFSDSHVSDRPNQKYEHVFLFSKSKRYFFDRRYLDGDGDVWVIPASATDGHSAAFPYDLAKRCVLTGSPVGGVVCDPFAGSGTTLLAAKHFSRHYSGCDLNPAYVQSIQERLTLFPLPLFADAPAPQPAAVQEALGL